MSTSEYTKVYYGNFILAIRIKDELERIGIVPIIKDEGESQRLAGYGSMSQGIQEIYVHNDELKKALEIVAQVKSDMEASSES
ncbi:putative signal transducing protein [Winogradskyella epiphytica]|uniref:Putative signal transducing protein n=1 Tax=Winogradskyella epiphytica TaxID=262005 RepID=A0A2V4XEN6_9FLAO|nr:DUF2007 domain-containing protein [Winogradskyella epiphytica]PYE81505.1 putative signal transducing protein [Winogradskyella epiphytica]GGW64693.1 hypothetical protein GCM10008085_15880 [Winogradskyella epiphytica]